METKLSYYHLFHENQKKKKSSRSQPERLQQKAFFKWLALYPKIRLLASASANGGSRHAIEARNLKLSGVTAGVPDVHIAIPSNGYHGLYIEFKYGDNKLTEAQAIMGKNLIEKGYAFHVCYSWIEAKDVTTEYLGDKLYVR